MKYLADYIFECLSNGKYFFTKDEVLQNLGLSDEQFRHQSYRLSKKNLIKRLVNDFFMIVPAEYAHLSGLPPHWIIDPLMHYLKQDYYIGLLTAASFYGATQQQPMAFQVIANKKRRAIKLARGNIEFHLSKEFALATKERTASPAGYANISSKEQTIIDLVSFYKVSGFLSNVTTVIKELVDECNKKTFKLVTKSKQNNSVLQRLGYILELINKEDYAAIIEEELSQRKTQFVCLRPDFNYKNGVRDNRFKIIINDNIEVEE